MTGWWVGPCVCGWVGGVESLDPPGWRDARDSSGGVGLREGVSCAEAAQGVLWAVLRRLVHCEKFNALKAAAESRGWGCLSDSLAGEKAAVCSQQEGVAFSKRVLL